MTEDPERFGVQLFHLINRHLNSDVSVHELLGCLEFEKAKLLCEVFKELDRAREPPVVPL